MNKENKQNKKVNLITADKKRKLKQAGLAATIAAATIVPAVASFALKEKEEFKKANASSSNNSQTKSPSKESKTQQAIDKTRTKARGNQSTSTDSLNFTLSGASTIPSQSGTKLDIKPLTDASFVNHVNA